MSGQANFGLVDGPGILPVRQPAGATAWVFSAAGAVVMAVAYFLTAKLSLALLEEADGVAVFWPAAGIASGVLIGFGSAARWPVVAGVIVGTLAANLLGDRNISSTIFFAVANAGEATVVAGLIQRFYGSPFELNALRFVLGLFAATIAATIASGIVGTLGFVFFYGSTASVSTIWFHWFASDALGTVTIAPLIIGFASLLREPLRAPDPIGSTRTRLRDASLEFSPLRNDGPNVTQFRAEPRQDTRVINLHRAEVPTQY